VERVEQELEVTTALLSKYSESGRAKRMKAPGRWGRNFLQLVSCRLV
jgi:hypothetical protein